MEKGSIWNEKEPQPLYIELARLLHTAFAFSTSVHLELSWTISNVKERKRRKKYWRKIKL
jgi:hypothetical protein